MTKNAATLGVAVHNAEVIGHLLSVAFCLVPMVLTCQTDVAVLLMIAFTCSMSSWSILSSYFALASG